MTLRRSVATPRLGRAFLLCAAAVTLLVSAPARPGAAVSALRFSIDDGYDVASDGLGEYVDFRLLPDPDDSSDMNYCVETQTGSLTFLFFNRDLDATGGAGSVSCDGSAPRRQYVLHIESADACTELMSHNYGWPDGAGGCFTNGHRNPRIRIDKLTVNRPRTTPIDFLIGRNPLNPVDAPTYRIESDGEATIFASGSTRMITYGFSAGQTFRLVKVDGGTSTKGKGGGAPPSWASPFVMTLSMTFTIETVTP